MSKQARPPYKVSNVGQRGETLILSPFGTTGFRTALAETKLDTLFAVLVTALYVSTAWFSQATLAAPPTSDSPKFVAIFRFSCFRSILTDTSL
jgi:hypothetical protein